MATNQTAANAGFDRIFDFSSKSGTISLNSIRQRAKRQLSGFYTYALKELRQQHIDIPPALGLTCGPTRQLMLDGEHPQAEQIQQWLDNNITLLKNFKEVEVLFEMVRATEQPGQLFPATSCFHIGLTSAGPLVYFQDYQHHAAGHA